MQLFETYELFEFELFLKLFAVYMEQTDPEIIPFHFLLKDFKCKKKIKQKYTQSFRQRRDCYNIGVPVNTTSNCLGQVQARGTRWPHLTEVPR